MAIDPHHPDLLSQLDIEDILRPAGRLIGYARTSTPDQRLDLQLDALRRVGVAPDAVFTDQASGANSDRPGLVAALAALEPGDTLVVWKLDRAGRSLEHLLKVLADLTVRGCAFRSLTESLDTATAAGRLLLHVMGAIAEFERDLTSERVREGVAARKRRGLPCGRRPGLTSSQVALAVRLQGEGRSLQEIADALGGPRPKKNGKGEQRLSKSTIHRALARASA